MNQSDTRLLVVVLNDPEKLDEILSGFLELGVTGATVVASEGMGRLLSADVPVFAGLQAFHTGARAGNRMIFSVIPQGIVDPALALLQDVCGALAAPATGIALVLPVDRVVGLAPELGESPSSL